MEPVGPACFVYWPGSVQRRFFSDDETPGDEFLTELALDLRASVNHSAEELWAQSDPETIRWDR